MRVVLTGAAGFQLINVNNVPLRLGGVSTDTRLWSRKALGATLLRHYRDQFVREAHKVGADFESPVRHQQARGIVGWIRWLLLHVIHPAHSWTSPYVTLKPQLIHVASGHDESATSVP